MAYSKHTWIEGETITAEKLYHLECGVDCLANCACAWSNHSPLAEFAGQSISLDTTGYRTLDFHFVIEDGGWQEVYYTLTKQRAYKDGNCWRFTVRYGNYARAVTVEDGQITFGDCMYGIRYNDKLIPYSIHGLE